MSPSEYVPVRKSHRPPETFLTAPEVAELLRVSKMTVYRLIQSGDIPANRIGRSLRVRERDLDAFLRDTETVTWTHEDGAA